MRVLAVGAHPDDVEIGCGGTLLRHLKEGDEVHTLVLTCGEGGNAPSRVRRAEAKRAASALGVTSIRFGDLHALDFSYVRQAYVEVIERAIAETRPDRLYCHNENDLHQNHVTAAKCSLIAAKRIPQVFSFRLPSTTVDFRPTFYVDVTEHMDDKLKVVRVFGSQSDKDYMQDWWVKSVAAGHAVEARLENGSLAEAFYVERMLWGPSG
jgi:LmbE family N-acetylglucosaminyl deacetylase